MSIFSRTRDIIAANVIDLIERSDDPAKTIRVIILEMEETLVEVRAGAARLIADQKEKRRAVAQLSGLQDSWSERAELALSKGRDDLARLALVEKEKLTGLGDELREEIATIDRTLRASEGDISKLQAKLREARVRQNAVATRFETAHNQVRLREMYAGPRTEEAFASFDLLERRAASRRARRRRARDDEAAEDRSVTLSLDGQDIGQIVEIAATVGSIVATLVIGFIVYLMVRPSKAERARRKAQLLAADPRESEEMWRVMDRMEGRLEVLERALADQIERPRPRADEEDRLFAPADQGRDSGRKE